MINRNEKPEDSGRVENFKN